MLLLLSLARSLCDVSEFLKLWDMASQQIRVWGHISELLDKGFVWKHFAYFLHTLQRVCKSHSCSLNHSMCK